MSEQASIFMAEKLLSQAHDESPSAYMWFYSALNRYATIYPDDSLSDFLDFLESVQPDLIKTYKDCAKSKGVKIVSSGLDV